MNIILTDLESDDLLFLTHYLSHPSTKNTPIILVASQNIIDLQIEKVRKLLVVLGRADITILRGSSSESAATLNAPELEHTRDTLVDAVKTHQNTTIMALNPIYDLLALLAALSLEDLSKIDQIHLYGSFNLRDVTAQLAKIPQINPYTPSTLETIHQTLLKADGKIHLYERAASLNDRDATLDNSNAPTFSACLNQANNPLADYLKKEITAWNQKIITGFITSMQRNPTLQAITSNTSVETITQRLNANGETALLKQLDKKLCILRSLEKDPYQVCFADMMISVAVTRPNTFTATPETCQLTSTGAFEIASTGLSVQKMKLIGDKNTMIGQFASDLIAVINQKASLASHAQMFTKMPVNMDDIDPEHAEEQPRPGT